MKLAVAESGRGDGVAYQDGLVGCLRPASHLEHPRLNVDPVGNDIERHLRVRQSPPGDANMAMMDARHRVEEMGHMPSPGCSRTIKSFNVSPRVADTGSPTIADHFTNQLDASDYLRCERRQMNSTFQTRQPTTGFGRASRDGDRPFRGRGDDERRAARPAREGGERPFRQRDGEERRPPRERGEERGRSERPFRERSSDGPRTARPPRREERGEGRSFGGGKRFDTPRGSNPTRTRPDRAHRNAAEIAEAVSAPAAPQEPERIAKVMARAGVASRRDSEAMIAEGRVSVNGKVIESPALDVGPNDVVLVDGEPLPARERTRLWFYHKPRGLVTTNHDPEGRPTVFDALPEHLPRVVSVGRLDVSTEGLLLLTNDGALARHLELPATGWLRRHRVRAHGTVTQEALDKLKDGIQIAGVRYGPIEATLDKPQGSNVWLTIGLREGKNREVRTILDHLGLTVNRLIRISFGPFQLLDLPSGEVESVKRRVLVDQLGRQMAESILKRNGLDGVAVEEVGGVLSDHYDPRVRKVRLSTHNYHDRSIAAIAVAAHEVGHAMQHAQGYAPLKARSALVPVASVGSNLGWIMVLAGILVGLTGLAWLGVALFAAGTIFALITLPVEFNASNRAKALVLEHGIVTRDERRGVDAVLNAAALTYVAAAVSTLLTLLYFLFRSGLLGGRR